MVGRRVPDDAIPALGHEEYSVRVGNASIMTVYDLRLEPRGESASTGFP
jgi:hypothetical protein